MPNALTATIAIHHTTERGLLRVYRADRLVAEVTCDPAITGRDPIEEASLYMQETCRVQGQPDWAPLSEGDTFEVMVYVGAY